MGSLYERLASKKPATRRVIIPLSDEAVQAHASAQRELFQVSVVGSDDAKAAAQVKLDAAKARLRDESVTIVVQALPRIDWDALQRAHPATKEQLEEAKKEFGAGAYTPWNTDTFLPAAWEACQVPAEGEERLSYEQCSQLVKGWSNGEQASLLQALQEANQTTVSVEALGK